MKINKKLILQVVPYVVSGAALIWCMKQCSSIDGVQAVNDAQTADITAVENRTDSLADVTARNGQAIAKNSQSIDRVAKQVTVVNDRVNAAMDSIDAINQRVDSLRAANKAVNARVDSLANATKACCKKAKKVKKAKAVSVKKPVVNTRPVVCDTVARVNVINSGTGNNNVVNINNGGTVNNYYNVPAPKAEPKVVVPVAEKKDDVIFTYRSFKATQVVVEISR